MRATNWTIRVLVRSESALAQMEEAALQSAGCLAGASSCSALQMIPVHSPIMACLCQTQKEPLPAPYLSHDRALDPALGSGHCQGVASISGKAFQRYKISGQSRRLVK